MKLELAILAGAESKAFLATLTKQIDRLEALTAGVGATSTKTKKSAAPVDEDEEYTDADTDEEEAIAPRKKAAKKAAATFEDEDEETEEDMDEAPVKKKSAKAPKLSLDDVNDACKAYAGEHSVKETRAILKKKFKVDSVNELESTQFAAVIAALAV